MLTLNEEDVEDIEKSLLMLSPLKMKDRIHGTQSDFGCGCLYESNNSKRYILSVQHLICNSEMPLGVVGWFDSCRCMPILYTSPFNSFKKFTISQSGFLTPLEENIDFIWREAPLKERYEFFQFPNPSSMKPVFICNIKPFVKVIEPLLDDDYMFGGPIECGFDFDRQAVTGDRAYYSCEYIKEEDEYHYSFQLDREVDQSQLKGLSGTPIFNRNHELVSLLVSGYAEGNVVKGINLWKLLNIVQIVETNT